MYWSPNYSGIYRFRVDYDVVASHSLSALQGITFQGWCCPIRVSQTPLVYELYMDRLETNPEIKPGRKFGKFELRRLTRDECAIIFTEPPFPSTREWTDNERAELNSLSGDEYNARLLAIQEKIEAETKAEYEKLKKHFNDVVIMYFQLLEEWGIVPDKDAVTQSLQSETEQVDAEKTESEVVQDNSEIQLKEKYASMWIRRGWVRMKGYNMTQWLQQNDAPSWLPAKELQRYIAKTHRGNKAGKYYKPK